MSADQLFSVVALSAVLLWLCARLMPGRLPWTFERLAVGLVAGGIVLALVLSVLHFMG